MKPIERDVIALFNAFWYRDFPLAEAHKSVGSRAEWTTHIGICIRSIADLLGYFTHFEGGIRTDAVIKDNSGNSIANVEWEWTQPYDESVNEIRKLYEARNTADVSVFIGYYLGVRKEGNIAKIRKIWACKDRSLIVFFVRFHRYKKARVFETLETYMFKGKTAPRRVRSQAALPWMLKGTRWEKKQSTNLSMGSPTKTSK